MFTGVFAAITNGRKQDKQQAPASTPAILKPLDEPTPEEVAEEAADRSVCIGELVIERHASHQEVIEVSQTLKDMLNADIFSVKPTEDGVSISCRVRDVSSFLSSLPEMPNVAAWAVAYPN